ncbi:aminotransferase class V-fold PLP-dependent enzyme [Saccharopolyspora erythraea]|uniref:pyridoxal-phosphate-dependent aminotransferase family protein n=1 Tax=Saccharopolyspora erythraea TaxID=1836 RepID=UPI001BA9EB96|nr:aminotransferase class V-fold PLP-dependent enzyme [Saccharopolyspora erythraea]QUH01857.1 aminotransferase class V-fold PLP-dependent enzyme [Saccharopolyspora erythraea]
MDEELILLNPGPACTSRAVKNALLRGDLCHREPEFAELLTSLRDAVPRAVGLGNTHESILLTGSGTAAMEAAVISAVRRDKAILVVNNGVYGDRLAKIARANGITAHEVSPSGDGLARWTTPIDPDAVRTALREHPDIDAVAVVHHETTTGMINPIKAIGEVVAETDAVYVIDSISGMGNEDQDLAEVQGDILCGSANKGLHGLPGLSFLMCSDKGIARLSEVPARSLYLNAASYLSAQRKGEVPFTPAVQVCYALDEALEEYEAAGGFAARTHLYRERAELVRSSFARLGLRILIEQPHRGNSVTTLHLPDGVSYPSLHDELKSHGYVIYAGQGGLSTEYFRICTLGEIPWHRLEQLGDALEQSIKAARS